jgi:uncharacterized protein YceH (UPF0502 family)
VQKLIDREPSLSAILPRLPGTKEARYAHLLSGPVESIIETIAQSQPESTASIVSDDRIAQLEAAVSELRQELAALSQKIDNLFG